MGKKPGLVIALLCTLALALSFALVGCASVDKTKYTGEWKMTQGSAEDLDAESIELMNSLGYEVTLILDENGTGSLDLFGDTSDVTWEAKSNTDGTLTVEDGGARTIKLGGSELVLEDSEGETMTFARAS